MVDKQKITQALIKHTNGAGVITKAQLSRFFGHAHETAVENRITRNLEKIDNKWFLVTDVAGEIARRMA